jgi:hypothetical protein
MSQTTLIQFPCGGGRAGSYAIPSSVTTINGEAFLLCTSLTSVTIPDGVTDIWDSTFDSCTSLTSVTIGNSVTYIDYSAIGNCTSLTNLNFLGNAPDLDSWFTTVGPGATVYYYYGTTGWEPTFGDLPTVMLGAPAPQISSGVGTLSGVVNQTIVVEASTNLADWQPIWTNTLSAVSTNFVDPQWLNHPHRFYRAQSY